MRWLIVAAALAVLAGCGSDADPEGQEGSGGAGGLPAGGSGGSANGGSGGGAEGGAGGGSEGGAGGTVLPECDDGTLRGADGACYDPTVTITAHPPERTASGEALFEFRTDDPNAGFQCSLDEGPPTSCASPHAIEVTDGPHTFSVAAVVGDVVAPEAATVEWSVDLTPPDTTIDTHPSNPSHVSQAVFTFHASEAGSTFLCTLDGGEPTACESGQTYSDLAPGEHHFSVHAVDELGNADPTPATLTWAITDPEPGALSGILRAHNDARAEVGVEPLAWDHELAAIAAAWANQCIDGDGNGLIDHNPNRSDGYPTYVGENIYGSTGTPSGTQAVELWVAEAADYDYESNTCAQGRVCGHYTQVVWRSTTHVGCAVSTCPGLTYRNSIVCNYAPGGNIVGSRPY